MHSVSFKIRFAAYGEPFDVDVARVIAHMIIDNPVIIQFKE